MFCSQEYLEGGITINTSPERKTKSLITDYPLSLLQEGVHSNKSTKDFSVFNTFLDL